MKTVFSGSGGAGRSPARKLWSTTHFLGEFCTPDDLPHLVGKRSSRPARSRGHQVKGECVTARGLRERTCLRSTIATTRETRAAAAAQGPAQHRVLRLHGTPALGNTHGSALLMRWAWPMSTAATARPGAPFVQKGEPFRGALPVEKSARVPAPKGAITCSPRSGRKISARRLESQS